jgi:hypothetical protein
MIKKDTSFTKKNIILNIFAAFITSYIFISYNDNVFDGLDGTYYLTLVKNQHEFMNFSPYFGMNFLQSIGNIFFPVNTYFIPTYLIFHIFTNGVVSKFIAASLFVSSLFAATLLVAIRIGFNSKITYSSAWALITILAFFKSPVIYALFNLIPSWLIFTTYPLFLLACFISYGSRTKKNDIFQGFFIVLILSILLLSSLVSSILWAISTIIFFIIILFSCGSAERRKKLNLLLLIFIFIIFLGVFPTFAGFILYTPSFFFPDSIEGTGQGWQAVSILFGRVTFNSLIGPLLWFSGVLGAIYAFLYSSGLVKKFAVGLIFFEIMCLILGVYANVLNKNYTGIQPIYLEYTIIPYLVIYSFYFYHLIFEKILNKLNFSFNQRDNNIYKFIAFLIMIIFILNFSNNDPNSEKKWMWPVPENKLVLFLKEKLSITDSDRYFKGRVLNISEYIDHSQPYQPFPWLRQHHLDGINASKYHNDFRLTGLWYFNIPTLVEYSSSISPPFFYIVNSFLTKKSDKQLRGAIGISKVNEKILKSMGVRYVISNSEINANHEDFVFNDLLVYELKNSNLGNYNPTKILYAKKAKDFKEIVENSNFDFSHSIVLFDELNIDLSHAKNSMLTINKGYMNIQSEAYNYSIIVLPLEFSNCIDVVNNKKDNKDFKILRANLNQTAILFRNKLDLDISLKAGFLNNQFCKIKDYQDMKDYELKILN